MYLMAPAQHPIKDNALRPLRKMWWLSPSAPITNRTCLPTAVTSGGPSGRKPERNDSTASQICSAIWNVCPSSAAAGTRDLVGVGPWARYIF